MEMPFDIRVEGTVPVRIVKVRRKSVVVESPDGTTATVREGETVALEVKWSAGVGSGR